ncbi:MAG TPA: hypothetical protein V6C71_08470 [Coleofasciculaceae cyanobacterium]
MAITKISYSNPESFRANHARAYRLKWQGQECGLTVNACQDTLFAI